MNGDREAERARVRQLAMEGEPEDLMERARAKARALSGRQTAPEKLDGLIARFWKRGPNRNLDLWNR